MSAKILIVDDVMLNIDVLTGILGDKYNIMAAVSGENAIKLLKRKSPDLILLDVYMPGIDGFGVMQYIQENEELARIPVIFVTGENDSAIEEKCLISGAVDYIKKPYNPVVIEAKIRNYLELKMYRDRLDSTVYERTQKIEESVNQLRFSREAAILDMVLISCDDTTERHFKRVRDYTRILAHKVAELYPDTLSKGLADQIALFSPLYNLGKVYLPVEILNKTGTHTSVEFTVIKTHMNSIEQLLLKTGLFSEDDKSADIRIAAEMAESYHGKNDTSVYPPGLTGELIPISVRIVTVADVYDALRSEKPCKRAYPHAEAVKIIMSGDDKTIPVNFDPNVLEAFRAVHLEFDNAFKFNRFFESN